DVVAPQESTKLLATKTAAEFPKKLFTNSHSAPANKDETKTIASTSPNEALNVRDEDLRKFLSRKTLVSFPERVTLHSLEGKASVTRGEGLSKKLAEEDSSSSSESDSSSDSEEDDSASEVASKTRVEFPRRDPFFFENRMVKMTLAEESLSQKRDGEYIPKKKPYKPKIEVPHIKNMEVDKTATANNKIIRKPSIKQSPNRIDFQKSVSKTQAEESQQPTTIKLKKSRHLVETPIGAPAAAQLKVPPGFQQEVEQKRTVLRSVEAKKREMQETGTKEEASPKPEEFLKDKAFMVNTAIVEEIRLLHYPKNIKSLSLSNKFTFYESFRNLSLENAEGEGVDTDAFPSISTETKTAAVSAQEEFDNSTYKNLQHHEYNMYTFVDFDVELSKFRQPQPSSGRLSPRH
uniref:NADH:ubiquinone oxidoreductase subunit V3 n=1 Tax=Pelodiscus sinensis TaxID=13735 RepID=K7GI05_PELSI